MGLSPEGQVPLLTTEDEEAGLLSQSRVRVEARPRVIRLALLNALAIIISGRHAGEEAPLQRSCVHSDSERVARRCRGSATSS